MRLAITGDDTAGWGWELRDEAGDGVEGAGGFPSHAAAEADARATLDPRLFADPEPA